MSTPPPLTASSACVRLGGMRALKPVSEGVEGQIRDAIRRNGVVIWLDRHRHYEAFAAELAGRTGAAALPVVRFRGSFLEVMQDLDGRVDGADPEPLILYLPGFLREDLRDTPLLEIVVIGTELQRGLETLVKEAAAGLVPADDVRAFLERPGIDLAAADACSPSAPRAAPPSSRGCDDSTSPPSSAASWMGTKPSRRAQMPSVLTWRALSPSRAVLRGRAALTTAAGRRPRARSRWTGQTHSHHRRAAPRRRPVRGRRGSGPPRRPHGTRP